MTTTKKSVEAETATEGAMSENQVSPLNVSSTNVPEATPDRPLQPPSVGRVVHYRLAVRDVQRIGELRRDALLAGNPHEEGQIVPAVIVRVFDANGAEGAGACNLKVMVDADVRDLWVTSATRGDANGRWNWPAKV